MSEAPYMLQDNQLYNYITNYMISGMKCRRFFSYGAAQFVNTVALPRTLWLQQFVSVINDVLLPHSPISAPRICMHFPPDCLSRCLTDRTYVDVQELFTFFLAPALWRCCPSCVLSKIRWPSMWSSCRRTSSLSVVSNNIGRNFPWNFLVLLVTSRTSLIFSSEPRFRI